MKKLLFISMLGEPTHYIVDNYKGLCSSGLEKDWILDWHKEMAAEQGFDLVTVDICKGEALPDPASIDAAILGGTVHVILEDREWLHRVKAWLRDYRKTEKPLFGMCGGHQLISTTFDDGALRGREGGTRAGTFALELTEKGKSHPLFEGISENPRFHFAHFLHVIPIGEAMSGRVLATLGGSPAVVMDHGGNWFTSQFHPESRKPEWGCFFKGDDSIDMNAYTDDHDGVALLKNYLKFARGCC